MPSLLAKTALSRVEIKTILPTHVGVEVVLFSKCLSGYSFETLFKAMAHQPDLMLLHSAQVIPNESRYSFFGIEPFATFVAQEGVYLWNGSPIALTCPWQFIQTQLKTHASRPDPDLPPFQGGVMGYWSYEFAHTLERLPVVPEPIGLPQCVLYFYDQVIAFDHQTSSVWLMARDQAKLAVLGAQLQQNSLEPYHSGEPLLSTDIQSNFTPQQYIEAVAAIKHHILQGDIFQANLTQQFQAKLKRDVDIAHWYWALSQANPAPMAALMKLPNSGYLLSSSPERFVSLQGRELIAEPIKGTRKRMADPVEDQTAAHALLNSHKDKAENVMIVDLMRNDLSRIAMPGTVRVPELCTLKTYETVHHLVSKITATLKPQHDAVDVLKAVFPPGSVTGAPKIKAMEIIASLEQRGRGPYCGCLGYISFGGDMDLSVVIRTYLVNQQQVYFSAGGAVVLDSNEEAEYAESLAKARVLREVLLS